MQVQRNKNAVSKQCVNTEEQCPVRRKPEKFSEGTYKINTLSCTIDWASSVRCAFSVRAHGAVRKSEARKNRSFVQLCVHQCIGGEGRRFLSACADFGTGRLRFFLRRCTVNSLQEQVNAGVLRAFYSIVNVGRGRGD